MSIYFVFSFQKNTQVLIIGCGVWGGFPQISFFLMKNSEAADKNHAMKRPPRKRERRYIVLTFSIVVDYCYYTILEVIIYTQHLSLYSTATQNTWHRGLAFGNAPDARILRWTYQHVGILEPTRTFKFGSCSFHVVYVNLICVGHPTQTRYSVEYGLKTTAAMINCSNGPIYFIFYIFHFDNHNSRKLGVFGWRLEGRPVPIFLSLC